MCNGDGRGAGNANNIRSGNGGGIGGGNRGNRGQHTHHTFRHAPCQHANMQPNTRPTTFRVANTSCTDAPGLGARRALPRRVPRGGNS